MADPRGRIVVGVDGSDGSIDAVRWAWDQARRTRGELEAVVAWQSSVEYAGDVSSASAWEARARVVLDDTLSAARLERGDDVRRTVRQGHPAAVLTDASTRADLVVVGSRELDGYAVTRLGSVSAHVAAHACCPVVVVPHLASTRHEQALVSRHVIGLLRS